MMQLPIYLDHAATTPVAPEVLQAMLPFWERAFGNPSAIYTIGQEAREAVEHAREQIARLVNADADEVYFTSGGTESDNWAIKGVARAWGDRKTHLITTPIEHHAVLEACKTLQEMGWEITFVPVDSTGLVDPDDVRAAITPRTGLISMMHANNEVGTIEPIAEIGAIAREHGIPFHTDAVQTVGRIPVDMQELNADLLSISAHKLYGPKGVARWWFGGARPCVLCWMAAVKSADGAAVLITCRALWDSVRRRNARCDAVRRRWNGYAFCVTGWWRVSWSACPTPSSRDIRCFACPTTPTSPLRMWKVSR